MGEAPSAAVPTSRRLRTITPPPPFLGWAREAASLEGVDPELGLAFWRVLRRVRAWSETPPGERVRLFGAAKEEARERLGVACAHAPSLVEALGTFALLVRAPGEVEPRRLSEACRQVHAWAEERSLLPVAMLFAEAAAYADPDDPARANDAGRMCRRAAQDERASSWYHRGYGLGVRRQDDTETIRAQIGYGNLMKDLGQYEEARKFLERAARRAINTGRRRQAGEAHHDLLLMSTELHDYHQAERHARLALKLYPRQHPRTPYFVHDLALMLVQRGQYTQALPVLKKLMAVIRRPDESVLVWSTYARAAAGANLREEFDDAERIVLELAEGYEEHASAAFVHLAEGARVLREWDLANAYATEAIGRARTRKNSVAERAGLAVLEKSRVQDPVSMQIESQPSKRTEALVFQVMARLRLWKAPGWSKPEAIPEGPIISSVAGTKA